MTFLPAPWPSLGRFAAKAVAVAEAIDGRLVIVYPARHLPKSWSGAIAGGDILPDGSRLSRQVGVAATMESYDVGR